MIPSFNFFSWRAWSFVRRQVLRPFRFRFPKNLSRSAQTAYPGPRLQAHTNALSSFLQQSNNVQYFVDYKKSRGCHFEDSDGNRILDLHSQFGGLPLGYNHPSFIKAFKLGKFDESILLQPAVQRPSPSITKILQSVPESLQNVEFVEGSGSLANEAAFKLAFMRYADRIRTGLAGEASNISYDEIEEARRGSSPKRSVLSFRGSMHGTSFGMLSISEINITSNENMFEWPKAQFPNYSWCTNEIELRQEDERCLTSVRDLIAQHRADQPITAIIMEGIGHKRNYLASNHFYKQIQEICGEEDIPLVVDETRCGGGITGQVWAHKLWNLPKPPDMVTFGLATQCSGVFVNLQYSHYIQRLHHSLAPFPLRIDQFAILLETINHDNLLGNVKFCGKLLKNGLEKIAKEKEFISNIRGEGLYISFNVKSEEIAAKLFQYLRNNAINLVPSSSLTFAIRPPLILSDSDVTDFLHVLEKFLNEEQNI